VRFLEDIVKKIAENNNGDVPSIIKLEGIDRAGFCFVSAYIHSKLPDCDILVVLENAAEQEAVWNDFTTWQKVLSGDSSGENDGQKDSAELLFFPAWDVLPNDGRLPGVDSLSERLSTITELVRRDTGAFQKKSSDQPAQKGDNEPSADNKDNARHGKVVIASAISLIQKTLSPEFIKSRTLVLKPGDHIGIHQITEHLASSYYEPVAKVSQKGEFSVRGGILDVYPLNSDLPVRIEFFGDLLDSMRFFDPITQISQSPVTGVVLPPAGEFAIIRNHCIQHTERQQAEDVICSTARNRGWELHGFYETGSAENCEDKSGAGNVASTLLDYLNQNAIVVLCEPEKIKESVRNFCSDYGEDRPLYCSWDELMEKASSAGMSVIELHEEVHGETTAESDDESEESDSDYSDYCSDNEVLSDSICGILDSLEAWRPLVDHVDDYQINQLRTQTFFNKIKEWVNDGFSAIIMCPQESQFGRIRELWEEFGLDKSILPGNIRQTVSPEVFETNTVDFKEDKTQPCGEIVFCYGSVNRGFIIPEEKVVVISDSEIFGRIKCPQPRSLKLKYRSQYFHHLIDIADLEEGDYVVHVNYGIGRFLGLTKLSESEKSDGEEYLVIEYAPSKKGQEPPKLYVPVSESHLITKYIGSGRGRPILNKLTGKKWLKTKEKAENAIKDYAAKLLSLQAERMSSPGFAFPPDTPWQHDFENAFEFEETPDQLQAILETKMDMESPKPMDRLVCGDAGYGKTEVALRAAFKAVMGGKQVAVLVPTTVLAQQHYMTFTSRMAAFPIRICMLSRFKTKGKQKELIEQIANGSIDIVIGTHRLIQDDVQFHDLGLLIIDEEQRFGVLHKEKLKFLKRKVDVLTLSATPIPRTLYLALMGARDMSIIQTPPHDRLPIETIVARYDDNLVRDAIRRELNRGGQVFYLHNQIYDIEEVGDKLKKLVPEARIVIGHGRMPAGRLEKVMSEFVSGKADVLLSTTIVENGLDIPNANTIIIDRADKYGLSDLYQLRGRVGRYQRQAYAYLLIPRHIELLADARKRISAIKQYSTPGSGFKIAMRDLEIRGAGNILGVEQSGHIAAIGFHLYCQLLNQAIKSFKGQKPGVIKNVTARFDFLITNPAREIPHPVLSQRRERKQRPTVFVPREVAYYCDDDDELRQSEEEQVSIEYAPAYIPADYIQDYSQRTEIYRKIAQASTTDELLQVENEIKDRFGKMPDAVKFFLKIEEIKIIAAEKGITSIETEGNKLKILRNNDYLMIGGKFPRLTKIKPEAKIKEIIHLLKSL